MFNDRQTLDQSSHKQRPATTPPKQPQATTFDYPNQADIGNYTQPSNPTSHQQPTKIHLLYLIFLSDTGRKRSLYIFPAGRLPSATENKLPSTLSAHCIIWVHYPADRIKKRTDQICNLCKAE